MLLLLATAGVIVLLVCARRVCIALSRDIRRRRIPVGTVAASPAPARQLFHHNLVLRVKRFLLRRLQLPSSAAQRAQQDQQHAWDKTRSATRVGQISGLADRERPLSVCVRFSAAHRGVERMAQQTQQEQAGAYSSR